MLHRSPSNAHHLSDSSVPAAFSLLRSKWARNFVLNSDSLTDAIILTSPVQLHYAIAGENAATVEGPEAPRTQLRETDGTAQWLFVPAFNSRSQGAGYLITKSKTTRDKGVTGGQLNAIYRVIRDDDTGHLVSIYDVPERRIMQIVSMRHVSATVRERDYFAVCRDKFRHLLLQSGSTSMSEISKCIITCFSIIERRVCPICSRIDCSCQLIVRPPRHASDFQHSARNMATHCGTFYGNGIMNSFKNGVCILQRPFHSQNITTGGSDAGLTYALNTWAVRHKLRNLKSYPKKSILFEVQQQSGRDQDRFGPPVVEVVENLRQVDIKSIEDTVDNLVEGMSGDNSDQSRVVAASTLQLKVVQGQCREKFRPLAPRGNVPMVGSNEEKGLQRKIQKRLAAQRNDKRRSENLKKLRSSLTAIRRKHEELEKRKVRLIEENVRLRRACRPIGDVEGDKD